ncbi:hypothetical protein BKA70DRAFT_1234163 [Coprinopsis sp. MPI-PUGE-AT-0042]|nr:hypothetical protein BKA70DRAFT_1234163 [Coprinopsis sp. MPI-PUGE-AT-0042]
MASTLRTAQNPSPASRFHHRERQLNNVSGPTFHPLKARQCTDRSKQNPQRTVLGDVSQPNIPKTSTHSKSQAQFQAPATAVIATKPLATSNRRTATSSNNRSQPSAAAPSLQPADSQPQNMTTQSLPKHLSSCGEAEAKLFFPARDRSFSGKPDCCPHNRHSVEDGSSIYFSSFHSFIANRVECEDCGISFSYDLESAFRDNMESEVQGALAKLPALEPLHELACEAEFNRLLVHMARLQVQFAMGVFVDRLKRMEASEAMAHVATHEHPDIRGIYKALAKQTRDKLYKDIQGHVEPLLSGDLGLITAFTVDLKAIKSEASFRHLEVLATERWDNPGLMAVASA